VIAHCSFAAACCCCCDIHCRLTATYTADFPSNFTCTWLYNSSDYLQFSCLSRARCWTPNNGNVHADTAPFPVAPFATCTVHHNVSPCDQYHFGLSFLLHGSFPLNFCLTKPRPPRTRPACPYLPGDTAATRSSIRHSFILLYYYCALITLLTFCLTFAAGPVDVALPCTPRLFPLRLPFPLRLAICFLHMFPTLS